MIKRNFTYLFVAFLDAFLLVIIIVIGINLLQLGETDNPMEVCIKQILMETEKTAISTFFWLSLIMSFFVFATKELKRKVPNWDYIIGFYGIKVIIVCINVVFLPIFMIITYYLIEVFEWGILMHEYFFIMLFYVFNLGGLLGFTYLNNLGFKKREFNQEEKIEKPKQIELPSFQKALQQCETKIADFSQKVQAAKTKLQQLPSIDYLNEKEKQAFTQQITQSRNLYQNQLDNYAASFFKLHLSQQKEKLGKIVDAVFNQGQEVEGEELNAIANNVNNLLEHEFWQHTNMDKSGYQALLPILAKLKKIDQRETFAEQVADLAPTKDLLKLDDHELQTQIELADLKNTQNLAQQTLTDFTQATQQLNDELARLQAENEVADKFG